MMFNIFKMYDEMLDMLYKKPEENIPTVFITREIPVSVEQDFNTLVDNFLQGRGYDYESFYSDREEAEC